MHVKTQKIHTLPHIKLPLPRLGHIRRLKVGSIHKPTKSRVKRFEKEYSLPLIVSACFLISVLGVAVLRASERSALIELLPSISEISQDYSNFLSGDKADEFTKNQDNNDSTPANTNKTTAIPTGNASSFAVNSGGGSASGTTSSGGTSAGGGTTPSQPFASSIASFQQASVALECSGGKVNKGNCSKRYTFNAGVRTSNGPGTVSYSWRSSLSSANQDASFSAGSGTVTTPLQKQILLACNNSANYTLQLLVNSPTPTQSAVLNINHNCNDI